MNNNHCGRWINRSHCFLLECLVADKCAFADYDREANAAFLEAVDKSTRRRPRILDDGGSVQRCEQCHPTGNDGEAVRIGDGQLSVSMVWAHNAFDKGVCRWVYICDECFRSMVTAANADKAWFDAWAYGIDINCPACRAELPTEA